ncbi:trafficking kinesin-binding protein 1-like [Xyrichtys novacula]|uniref:Trafficking kinesin-binding protein 1-like n=1 Tax=Xyrichtys novacula TaxID=13765 RepID=A0AAV1HFF2_XYRNO|nr:trafficking kinesin-binding protein 1-like [Xyrichtys novacula]
MIRILDVFIDCSLLYICNLDPDPDPDPDKCHPNEEQYVSEGELQFDTQPAPDCRDAETITDVCNSTDLPEFEIISLLEEQLPVYRLRADTVYGYDNDDWLHTPLVAPDTRFDLTTEQIEETLKYFLLCADRVGQMTKTYNDIDAVTRLLEEKERDLELAARIGQSLLKKNRTLTEQNEYLEERVGQITEEMAQLHHELNLKDELLQFYTNAAEESEDESGGSPTGRKGKLESAGGFVSDTLQRKLKDLEEENLTLRSEANHLKSETETYEEKEQQLVNDCVKELRSSSLQISAIAEELARKTEDASRQQEEITHLLSQIVDLQKKAKSYAVENEELSQHLIAAKDAQRQLTAELQELEEKYSECIEMLHEAQEELKNLRNRNYPAGTPRRFHPLGLYPMDSLAAEIEGTMRKELSLDDPECEEQKSHRKRVFETVKTVNQTVRQRSLTPTSSNIPGSNQSLSARTSPQSSGISSPHSTIYECDISGESGALDNRTQSMLMETASNQDNTENREKKASGAEDLRLALRRLSLRRQNNLSERRFFEEERDRRRGGHGGLHDALGQESVMTPSESIMSLGNLHVWASRGPYLPDKLQIVKPLEGSATLHHWQQLAQPHLGVILDARPGVVPKGYRPLELELEQVYPWGGLEEDEPGEQYFQNLPTSSAVASPAVPPTSSTSDPNLGQPPASQLAPPSPPSPSPSPHLSNTDVLAAYYPGKCMAHTSSTYTFTTCRILHPTDEQTRVTPSLNPVPSSSSCVMTSTLLGTPAATPCTPRRLGLRPSESSTNLRDATRTTSTSLGLVRLLQERGISAAMYHQSLSLEQGQGNGGVLFSTSVAPNRAPNPDPLRPSTPPNSPTGEGTSTAPTPVGFDFKSPSYDNFLASKPARSILKEVTGRMRGRQRGRDCESQTDVSVTVHNLNLLDKVKRLGVAGASGGRAVSPSPILGPLGGLRRSGSPFGPDGIRRNRSYPAMVGASMAMKAPGPQE